MNTAAGFIVLLACIAVCSSIALTIRDCRCLTTVKAVQPALIKSVTEQPPRPYCSRTEVIALLKNGSEECLDPSGQFAKDALVVMRRMAKARAARRNSTRSKLMAALTTASTTSTPTTTPSLP